LHFQLLNLEYSFAFVLMNCFFGVVIRGLKSKEFSFKLCWFWWLWSSSLQAP
jgi:hypothetical protein